ncbi:ATPase [Candidatus Peregrinibacteria bacterium]|jgi:uncharacterized protein|nr:ATPase [Candidatus Peregrinibacteria bacterium]
MNDCCDKKEVVKKKKKFDWLLWGSVVIVAVAYFGSFFLSKEGGAGVFSQSIFDLMNKMSWGLALGILFVGILAKLPRELIVGVLGKGGTFSGILRATGAGVMLDLCSHGILLIGMQLYRRGASLGQMIAFLVASPWNSLSLTLVLWALVGFKWMAALLIFSMVIAVISGMIFDWLVKRGILPENPNKLDLPKDFRFFPELRAYLGGVKISTSGSFKLLWIGLKGSRMILRWIFFGVILAALIRTFVPPESFSTFFGPTIGGLGLTLLVATILEVCSEGSAPIAADILTRAGAPGNAFAFLMTGVSTDYTEIMTLRETTGSWKIAFFLPLVTLPQIVILAILMNGM